VIKKIIGSHRSRVFIRPFCIIAAFFFFSAGDKCDASEEEMILIPAGPFKMGSSDKDIMCGPPFSFGIFGLVSG